jgi:hypothetical protein
VAFVAERDLWLMVETVIRRREQRLVKQVLDDLSSAETEATNDARLAPADRVAVASRIRNLRRFAATADVALDAFVRSRRLDLRPLVNILVSRPRRPARG